MNVSLIQADHSTAGPIFGSKRILATIALCMLVLAQFGAEAQAAPKSGAFGVPVFVDPLVGTWNVAVDIWNCDTEVMLGPQTAALALFNADGTRHETNATNPALRTPAYGNWHRVQKGEYEFAFKFFRFDDTGANIGSTTVRHDLYLSDDHASYYSEGTAEVYNSAGALLFMACSTAMATRFE